LCLVLSLVPTFAGLPANGIAVPYPKWDGKHPTTPRNDTDRQTRTA